jgi:hypothetical protein
LRPPLFALNQVSLTPSRQLEVNATIRLSPFPLLDLKSSPPEPFAY